MNDKNIFLIASIIAVLGQLFTLGIFVWQLITNTFSFWYWFSLIACFGYGLSIACLRDINKLLWTS